MPLLQVKIQYFSILILYQAIVQVLLSGNQEVDWPTYVQQFEVILKGEFDYAKIRGNTGWLFYPAGHVYQFSIIYFLYINGKYYLNAAEDGKFCWCLYIFLFLIMNYILFKMYDVLPKKDRWIKIFLILSKQLKRAIIIVRFNDIFSMIPLYLCIYFLINNQKKGLYYATFCYAFALASKTNVLLFLPGLLYIFTKVKGPLFALIQLLTIIISQFLFGYPFINANASNYLSRAYDFSRTFDFIETMNWKMLPENIFLHPLFHKFLFFLHMILLAAFLFFKWEKLSTKIFTDLRLNDWSLEMKNIPLNKAFIVRIMFICNFIGIFCFRSLHFQFIIWFYGTLPFLIWSTKLNGILKFLLICSYEFSFADKTPFRSILIFIANFSIVIALLFYDHKYDKEALNGKLVESENESLDN